MSIVKEFFGVEWKKFILPVLLIILFVVVINSFYSLGSVMDKYGCEMVSLVREQITNVKQNNTFAINQTANKMKSLSENIQKDMKKFQNIEPVFNFLKMLDPIIPVPCEFMDGNFCRFYINESTYNCLTSLKTNEGTGLTQPKIVEYKRASIITFGLNGLLLFTEGYLISSLILFIYRKIIKNRPPTSP